MRISRKVKSPTIRPSEAKVSQTDSFDQVVQSQIKSLEQQELYDLMEEMMEQGEKLARFRMIQDLLTFKRMVKVFLEKTVYSSLHVKKDHHFSLHGKSQHFTIIEELDEKLLVLTEAVLDQEKKNIHILEMLGEIKGLLINIYR